MYDGSPSLPTGSTMIFVPGPLTALESDSRAWMRT